MFSLINQVLFTFSSFGGSLPTKCVLLHNEPCTIRPTLIDSNTVELDYDS